MLPHSLTPSLLPSPPLSSPQFPEHPYGDLLEKVLLYRHTSDNSLAMLTDSDPIEDGTIIDIVLAGEVTLAG